jgi:hypothetical protein
MTTIEERSAHVVGARRNCAGRISISEPEVQSRLQDARGAFDHARNRRSGLVSALGASHGDSRVEESAEALRQRRGSVSVRGHRRNLQSTNLSAVNLVDRSVEVEFNGVGFASHVIRLTLATMRRLGVSDGNKFPRTRFFQRALQYFSCVAFR